TSSVLGGICAAQRPNTLSGLGCAYGPINLMKNDSALAIQQDAMFDVCLDSTCEHHRFDVTTHSCEVLGIHRVINVCNILFDDWALVDVFGDIMGRGTNDFHHTCVGLMIRPRDFKTG